MTQSERARAPWSGAARMTMPLVLAGAITVSMGLTGPIDAAHAAPKKPQRVKGAPAAADPAATTRSVIVTAAAARVIPLRHTVASGESVSSIAARYGVATAAVLAANGLGWRSLIFPGQVLTLPGGTPAASTSQTTAASTAGSVVVARGDTISGIAQRHGMTTAALLAANRLSSSSIIYPGQRIAIPGRLAAPAPARPTAQQPSAPPTTATPTQGGRYTIRTGDTVSSIAKAHGVSVAAVLAANGLTAASLIYAGRTLVIPAAGAIAATPASSVTPIPTGAAGVTRLTQSMAANAAVIVRVGRQLGVPDRGIVIALATAMQESGLQNLDGGHLDSVGLFQQRPSKGWGTVAQLTDPAAAAKRFYGGPSNPNRGVTRGLLDIPGWQGMTLTQAAQAVQVSAYPNAYARWEASATAWLAQLG